MRDINLILSSEVDMGAVYISDLKAAQSPATLRGTPALMKIIESVRLWASPVVANWAILLKKYQGISTSLWKIANISIFHSTFK